MRTQVRNAGRSGVSIVKMTVKRLFLMVLIIALLVATLTTGMVLAVFYAVS